MSEPKPKKTEQPKISPETMAFLQRMNSLWAMIEGLYGLRIDKVHTPTLDKFNDARFRFEAEKAFRQSNKYATPEEMAKVNALENFRLTALAAGGQVI